MSVNIILQRSRKCKINVLKEGIDIESLLTQLSGAQERMSRRVTFSHSASSRMRYVHLIAITKRDAKDVYASHVTTLVQGIYQILKVEHQPISFSCHSLSKLNASIAYKQVRTTWLTGLWKEQKKQTKKTGMKLSKHNVHVTSDSTANPPKHNPITSNLFCFHFIHRASLLFQLLLQSDRTRLLMHKKSMKLIVEGYQINLIGKKFNICSTWQTGEFLCWIPRYFLTEEVHPMSPTSRSVAPSPIMTNALYPWACQGNFDLRFASSKPYNYSTYCYQNWPSLFVVLQWPFHRSER